MPKQIAAFRKKKILVVGDIMVDRFTSGRATKLSPEAPVPVVVGTGEYAALGGAGNVAHNISALGGKAILCGVIGDDSGRREFLRLAKAARVSTEGVVADKTRPTILKHRFLADGVQLARFDTEDARGIDAVVERTLIRNIKRLVPACDAIIISDYAKGTLTENVAKALKATARAHKKKIIADIKPAHAERFTGVDLITPNLEEARAMSGTRDVGQVGRSLTGRFKSDVFITRGGEGISVFGKKGLRHDVPGRTVQVFDVTGAGDTVTAIAALALASHMTLPETAQLANAAGSIVVQKPGTATVTLPDLLSIFTTHLESSFSVEKVWGKEQWLENNENYCCKLLTLKKGYQCSLHYHKIKDEMFLVTKGHMRLELGKKVLYLREGNFVRVPTGAPHRFRGLEDTTMIEISTHHDDEDSYRLEESKKVDD